jgi:hypothetical protein
VRGRSLIGRKCLKIYFEELGKDSEICRNNLPPGRHKNPGPTKYKAGLLNHSAATFSDVDDKDYNCTLLENISYKIQRDIHFPSF